MSQYSFETLDMLLTNHHDKTLSFTAGTSVVTLNFRKRKHFNTEFKKMVRHVASARGPKFCKDFFSQQTCHGMPVFVSGLSHRCHEIGSFYSVLMLMVLPWLKTGGKSLIKEELLAGLQVAHNDLSCRNFGESI